MRRLVVFGVVALGLSMSSAISSVVAAEFNPPVVAEAGFHTGYLPDGFDTNDFVQVVGEGVFRNSCYRPAAVQVDVDHVGKKIMLRPYAYQYDGFCLQVLVPYDQTLDVGFLKRGTYQVVQKAMGAETVLGDVKVRMATNALPDDYLYAPISQAYFENRPGKGATVKLAGAFTNSCMKLADVRVSVQPKVLVLQPVSDLDDRDDCVEGSFPFEREVRIGNLKEGRYLLHVRSLNGKAVNTLVDVR